MGPLAGTAGVGVGVGAVVVDLGRGSTCGWTTLLAEEVDCA